MTNLLALSNVNISVLDALILSLLGMLIVFAVLVILMFIIWAMGKIGENSPAIMAKLPKFNFGKKKAATETSTPVVAENELAPGSCGDLLLVKTEERDAAMIMAIVADSTGIPLNQLKFKSIKRIDQEEEK